MPSLFRVYDWSLSTKFTIGVMTAVAVPPLAMGALGLFRPLAPGLTIDRMLYLAAALCAIGLVYATFRAFSQQASQITTLITKLNTQTPRLSGDPAEHPQGTEGGNGPIEKTLALIQSQTEHLATSVTTMEGLTSSIEQVAEHVALSATTAEETLTNAQHSVTTVQSVAQGCQHLRLQLQDTAKRIKHLEEHAREVEALGASITDLADRTSVLALNVSVHAARADGVGHASAVVAAEVEHLAGRTVEATRHISHLVHTIQRETGEVVDVLEAHTNHLAQWAEHTTQTSQALGKIEQLSEQLTALIQAISQAVAHQASSSAALSKTMGEMSAVTQQTAAGTKQMATSMHNVSQLAGALRSSVNGQRQAA